MELDALPNLMKMVNSTIGDEAVRALHAVSHIVRDNLDGLEKFYSEYGGAVMIQVKLTTLSNLSFCREKNRFINQPNHLNACEIGNNEQLKC